MDRLSDVTDWVDGIAKCPHNPAANITALISDTGDYYIGGPTDFTGSDAAIYRTNIGKHGKQLASLRTNQYNSKWLDNPQFVGSFETNHFVYTIFRENAIEYSNCGKVSLFFSSYFHFPTFSYLLLTFPDIIGKVLRNIVSSC